VSFGEGFIKDDYIAQKVVLGIVQCGDEDIEMREEMMHDLLSGERHGIQVATTPLREVRV
jgi:hypothetical protein